MCNAIRRGLLCVLCALLLFGCGRTQDADIHTPDAQTTDFPTPEETIAYLSGPECKGRVTGSSGNDAASEYLAALLEQLGLTPVWEDYFHRYDDFLRYPEQAEPKLTLISADGTCTALTAGVDYLHSLPASDVAGTFPVSDDAALCENGDSAFFAEDHLQASTFCFLEPRRLALYCEKLSEAKTLQNTHEAKGLVLLFDESLRERLEEPGTQIELSIRKSAEKGKARNVAAVLRGSEGKNALIFGAHFDGSGVYGELLFPSAYDNASGTAAVLETARLVTGRETKPKNDLVFVFFNGEEAGLNGSAAFSADISKMYDTVNYINVDCVGHQDSNGIFDVSCLSDRYAALKQAVISALGPETAEDESPSDHISFTDANTAAVGIVDSVFGKRQPHTAEDVPEIVEPEVIEKLGAVLASFAEADTVYPPLPDASADEPDSESEAMLTQLTSNGTLSHFGDVYIPEDQTNKAMVNAMTGADKLLLSIDEVAKTFPGCTPPEEVDGCPFTYTIAQAMLKDSVYSKYLLLHGDFLPGRVYDLTDQLTPYYFLIFYRAEDGRALTILLQRSSSNSGTAEDGSVLSPELSGWELEHLVSKEYDIDGYWGASWTDERGVCVSLYFEKLDSFPSTLSAWEDPTQTLDTKNRFIPAEELTALLNSYDFRSMTSWVTPPPFSN